MNYLIWNTNIVCKTPREEKVISKDRDALRQIKGPVQIALVRTIPKKFSTALTSPEELERLALRDLPPKSVACYEKIGEDTYQAFGAEESLVNEVKNLVGAERIDLLIPYAVTIRNLLEKENLLSKEYTIFLDDSKGNIFFAIFQGKKASLVRIFARETLLEEYRIGLQDFREHSGIPDVKFKIVTNSHTFKKQLIEQSLATFQDVSIIDISIPAVAGLQTGKREIEFILPEQVIRKQRIEEKKKRTKLLRVIGSIALAGLLIAAWNYTSYNRLQRHIKRLEKEKAAHIIQLEKDFKNHYPEIIQSRQNPYLTQNLDKFFTRLPVNYNILLVSLMKDKEGHLGICAYLIPQKHVVAPVEEIKKIYPTALVEQSSIRGAPAIRMIYGVNPSGEEVSGEIFRDWKFLEK